MIKFHLLRNSRDILGHMILIFLPILLISFFAYIYSSGMISNPSLSDNIDTNVGLTLGISLTFHIYGAAISFETIGNDFLTPMADRLRSTPIDSRKIILSILLTSIIISFIQTLVIIVFSIVIIDIKIKSLFLIIIFLFISVIFNQLMGVVILLFTKKVKTTISLTTIYAIFAPMISGLYFPLPKGEFINFIQKYLTPMSLTQTSLYGLVNNNRFDVIVGITPIIILTVILILLINPLTKRVIV